MNQHDNLICKVCMSEIIDEVKDPLEVIDPCASVQETKSDESFDQICSNCLGFEQIKIKTECEEIYVEETKIVNVCNSEEAEVKQESETLPISFINVKCNSFCDNVKIECNYEEWSDECTRQETKRYHCNICNKNCRNPSNLKRHLNTHTGEKPFKCDTCDREFAQFSSLKRHKPIHSPLREKTYKCGVCSNFFYTLNDLNAHRKLHTGQKPFECDVCDKRFVRAYNLTLHKQIHVPREKTYKCDVCRKLYYTSGELRKHQKTHSASAQKVLN